MRIGINTLFLIPNKHGGGETYLRNLLLNLAKIDRENEYILFTNRENSGTFGFNQENFLEVLCDFSASHKPVRIFWEQLILPMIARKHCINVLHSPVNVSPFLGFHDLRSIVTIHDMQYIHYPENFPKGQLIYYKNFVPVSAKKSNKIISVSYSSKKDIVNALGTPEEKIIVVYLACNEEVFREKINTNRKKEIKCQYSLPDDYILSVASLNRNKNLERLIEAYYLAINKYGIKHKLVLTGMWLSHGKKIMQTIERLNIKDRVFFLGYVEDEHLPYLYSLATLFSFPSYFEGFGLPLLEAMACGCPVVASSATSVPEVVGDAAILVNPFDTEELSDAMYKVLANKELRDSLITRGFERVKLFSWERTARETVAVYEEVCKS